MILIAMGLSDVGCFNILFLGEVTC